MYSEFHTPGTLHEEENFYFDLSFVLDILLTLLIDDHQIIPFMCKHVTRFQRKQKCGSIRIVVEATVIIFLAQTYPTEKMSILNFNLELEMTFRH
jgi:hypothetical protein